MGENQVYTIENSRLELAEQEMAGHFFVRGHFENERFVASGHILGEADFATDGTPGWFELSAQKFYSQQTAQAPVSPYVIGFMTKEKGFVPSKRDIY